MCVCVCDCDEMNEGLSGYLYLKFGGFERRQI